MHQKTLQSIIDEITEWQRKTFPYATPQSAAAHLKREAAELFQDPYDGSEMADIFFLLIAVAHTAEIDLIAEVEEKLRINKNRQWGKPDAEGVVEHIRQESKNGGTILNSPNTIS